MVSFPFKQSRQLPPRGLALRRHPLEELLCGGAELQRFEAEQIAFRYRTETRFFAPDDTLACIANLLCQFGLGKPERPATAREVAASKPAKQVHRVGEECWGVSCGQNRLPRFAISLV
jgi:hypothetical protein